MARTKLEKKLDSAINDLMAIAQSDSPLGKQVREEAAKSGVIITDPNYGRAPDDGEPNGRVFDYLFYPDRVDVLIEAVDAKGVKYGTNVLITFADLQEAGVSDPRELVGRQVRCDPFPTVDGVLYGL